VLTRRVISRSRKHIAGGHLTVDRLHHVERLLLGAFWCQILVGKKFLGEYSIPLQWCVFSLRLWVYVRSIVLFRSWLAFAAKRRLVVRPPTAVVIFVRMLRGWRWKIGGKR